MEEHSATNREVGGSSPSGPAKFIVLDDVSALAGLLGTIKKRFVGSACPNARVSGDWGQ